MNGSFSPGKRWNRFWFAGEAPLSLSVCRIGVATSVLLSLYKLHTPNFDSALAKLPVELYNPVGILRILGSGVPSAGLLGALQTIAWLATIAMLFGLAARVSTVVSLVTALALASFQSSFSPGWHHVYPLVFLAQIPLAFAPVGDVLSIDALIRKRRRRAPPSRDRGNYVWGVRLVQFAIALVFFNAFHHKIIQAGFSLDWALSDNLRHHLLMRYDWVGRDRSPVADWLLQSEYRYKTAALLNLAAQSLPLVACFVWRRAWLRLALGSLFAIETIALGLVMEMWNLHWLPLAVVFVDWDRLLQWIGKRLAIKNYSYDAPTTSDVVSKRLISSWIGFYLLCWLVLGFMHPPIDQKANLFPFSRFPMFSGMRVSKPYDQHRSYEVLGTRLQIDSHPPVSKRMQSEINRRYSYRWLHRISDPQVLEARLASVAKDMKRRYKIEDVKSVTLWLTVFQAPAYPAKAEFIEHRIAISGHWSRHEPFVSYLRAVKTTKGSKEGQLGVGRAIPDGATVLYHPDDGLVPVAISLEPLGTALENSFYYRDVVGDAQVFVVHVPQEDGSVRPFTLSRAPRFGW